MTRRGAALQSRRRGGRRGRRRTRRGRLGYSPAQPARPHRAKRPLAVTQADQSARCGDQLAQGVALAGRTRAAHRLTLSLSGGFAAVDASAQYSIRESAWQVIQILLLVSSGRLSEGDRAGG